MSVRRILFVPISCLLPAFLFLSCANQLPPQGGPVDTVPPVVVATYPAPYTIRFKDDRIRLEFDKYVDHRSVEESIFISPYVGDLSFDWSGKEVEISFSERLKPAKTYVVNVGTDVVDLNNRNRMAQAFTLAFSTGDDIDHGAIRGRVYAIKPADHPEGVMIFAYQLADLDPDTLNPRSLKPDYITQTGKSGEFFLQHLAFGTYRVFAVRDEFRNLLYDPEADDFGVPSRPLVLIPADTLQDNVLMQLAKEDTTAPRLVRVDAHDAHHLLIEFSEPLDTSIAVPLAVSVIDTLSRDKLNIVSIFPNLPKLSLYTVVTDKQDSTRSYRLTVVQAHDLVGLPISQSANSLVFSGAPVADSSATRIAFTSIADSARGIPLKPAIRFQFSDAMRRESTDNAIEWRDSTGKMVPAMNFWLNDAALVVLTPHGLLNKSWYTLTLLLHNLTDWSGKNLRDSLKVVRFETLDAEMLSSIDGSVVDKDTSDVNGTVYVAADAVDVKEPKAFTAIADRNGNFLIPGIEEGRYVLRAYRDRNGNGKFDPGRPFPFAESERFNVVRDTIKVRARWPLEGVRIELK